MVRLWICDKITKMVILEKTKNPFIIGAIIISLLIFSEGVAFFMASENQSDVENIVDMSLAPYSDRQITENAKVKNEQFEKLVFAPIQQKKESFYSTQLAGVLRAFKFIFYQKTSNPVLEYGTWVWTPTLQMSDEYISLLLTGAKKEGINTIYLSIDSYLDIYTLPSGPEKEEKEKLFTQILEKFINMAGERGIAVDAEAGWRNWAEEGQTYKPFIVANYVKEFNRSHEAKFRGFQYDIEPYLLDYYKDNKEAVLADFIKLVDQTVSFLDSEKLRFSVVVPDFYDKKDRMTPVFAYGDRRDFVFEHLLDVLEKKQGSSIVIMSYRNFAEGRDGSIDISKNEIRTASLGKFNTSIILAQEVGDVPPSYITFHNTSKSYLMKEISKLTSAFNPYKNFGGIAVHYANAFLSMSP